MFFFGRKKKRLAAEEKARLEAEQQAQAKQEEEVTKEVTKEKEVPVKTAETTEEKVKTTPKKPAKYHVSQNKDEKSEHYKKWRVRKEGSDKTIKFLNTQLEAIELAQELADKAGSSIVIHKVDGSIRKQEYKK